MMVEPGASQGVWLLGRVTEMNRLKEQQFHPICPLGDIQEKC